jgi:hypothetical protein
MSLLIRNSFQARFSEITLKQETSANIFFKNEVFIPSLQHDLTVVLQVFSCKLDKA